MAKNVTEDTLASFANETENVQTIETIPMKVKPHKMSNKEYDEAMEEKRQAGDMPYLGWQKLDIEALPSMGKFYPNDTKIFVRSATGGEIKHWSTIVPDNLQSIDAAMNYVIERCCKISIPGIEYMGGNWKDLIDVDRLYILFAIRDLTFIKGENELKFPVSETKTIPILKDNIDFIQLPESIMKYYDADERCFVLKFKSGRVVNMYLTSLGVADWIKKYITTKEQSREQIDKDFIQYAPLLIKSHRKFSTRAYEMLVEESNNWSPEVWAALSYFKDVLTSGSEPIFKYIDETGVEQTAPLTFLGGIKSILSFSDPLSGLM